jgi:hypothetical protein
MWFLSHKQDSFKNIAISRRFLRVEQGAWQVAEAE